MTKLKTHLTVFKGGLEAACELMLIRFPKSTTNALNLRKSKVKSFG